MLLNSYIQFFYDNYWHGSSKYIYSRTGIYHNFATFGVVILKEDIMKSGMRDKAEGAIHEAKGALKEAAGKLCANEKLTAEGAAERVVGKTQEMLGRCKYLLGK